MFCVLIPADLLLEMTEMTDEQKLVAIKNALNTESKGVAMDSAEVGA